jgi:hypothetical protein
VAPPVFKTGLAANIVAGGFDSLPPPPSKWIVESEDMQMRELIPVAEKIGAMLKTRSESVAVAESTTGGLISAAILSVAGASAYFIGGGVVYTLKGRRALGIPDEDFKGFRSVTEQYSIALARRARARFGATWAIAEIGARAQLRRGRRSCRALAHDRDGQPRPGREYVHILGQGAGPARAESLCRFIRQCITEKCGATEQTRFTPRSRTGARTQRYAATREIVRRSLL